VFDALLPGESLSGDERFEGRTLAGEFSLLSLVGLFFGLFVFFCLRSGLSDYPNGFKL